jgi:hypothetical protein
MKNNLTIFDRINMANCARQRAMLNLLDEQRFIGEYDSARAWTKYRCYISTVVKFVETN